MIKQNLENLPNFLIVGAAKSGTTSLYRYLNQHSKIFLPSYKEPHFFVNKKVAGKINNYIDNLDAYLKLFENAENYKHRGEASVFYLYYYDEAIKYILKTLGKKTKIIILLRNPIDRAYSAYKQVTSGIPDLMIDFESAIKNDYTKSPDITPMFHLKEMGLYSDSVKAYMNSFDDVYVSLFDDFINQTEVEISNIIDFLGIEREELNASTKYNTGRREWRNKSAAQLKIKNPRLKKVLQFLKINKFYKKVFTKKFNNMKPEVKYYLHRYYMDDINKLSHLLQTDLSHWTKNNK